MKEGVTPKAKSTAPSTKQQSKQSKQSKQIKETRQKQSKNSDESSKKLPEEPTTAPLDNKREKIAKLLKQSHQTLQKGKQVAPSLVNKGSPSVPLPSLAPLYIDRLTSKETSSELPYSQQEIYELEIHEILRSVLSLAENDVTILMDITIQQTGKVSKIHFRNEPSERNRNKIEKIIKTTFFPPLTSAYPGEKEHTFPCKLTGQR